MCMEKSLRHGKTDKTQKIALNGKFMENGILIKQNFKSTKQKNYGFMGNPLVGLTLWELLTDWSK